MRITVNTLVKTVRLFHKEFTLFIPKKIAFAVVKAKRNLSILPSFHITMHRSYDMFFGGDLNATFRLEFGFLMWYFFVWVSDIPVRQGDLILLEEE